MVTVLLNQDYFFTLVVLILWLFFIYLFFDYSSYKRDLLIGISIFALGLGITLSIMLSFICFEYQFGYIIVLIIPLFNIYLLISSLYEGKGE